MFRRKKLIQNPIRACKQNGITQQNLNKEVGNYNIQILKELGYKIVKEYKNYNNEKRNLFIGLNERETGTSIDLCLVDDIRLQRKLGFTPLSRILVKYINNSTLKIEDIYVTDINRGKGYTSLLIDQLKIFASENNIQEIHGDISSVDAKDHIARLKRFYDQNNFEIDYNDHTFSGTVIYKV
ncbi:hypothetical protein [Heyndrickxia ginsengihumi]|uniref:hypothetical protein n=1 Tax=Heyndrickxia ginsengihumi TaxID=363870 RepID=UPI00046FF70E|nr:hypothetical protein [Heyndrickxia ginsengihumi]